MKTTISGFLTGLFALLAFVAQVPTDLQAMLMSAFPHPTQQWLALIFALAAFVSHTYMSKNTQDTPTPAIPTGGTGLFGKLPLMAVCLVIGYMAACTTTQFVSWWKSPSTQAGVKIAGKAAFDYGLQLAGQALNGERINYATAGINTAFIEARSLQLTSSAADPVAIVTAVKQSIDDPTVGRKLAAIVVLSAQQAVDKGADPSGALEGALRGVTAAVNAPTPIALLPK